MLVFYPHKEIFWGREGVEGGQWDHPGVSYQTKFQCIMELTDFSAFLLLSFSAWHLLTRRSFSSSVPWRSFSATYRYITSWGWYHHYIISTVGGQITVRTFIRCSKLSLSSCTVFNVSWSWSQKNTPSTDICKCIQLRYSGKSLRGLIFVVFMVN